MNSADSPGAARGRPYPHAAPAEHSRKPSLSSADVPGSRSHRQRSMVLTIYLFPVRQIRGTPARSDRIPLSMAVKEGGARVPAFVILPFDGVRLCPHVRRVDGSRPRGGASWMEHLPPSQAFRRMSRAGISCPERRGTRPCAVCVRGLPWRHLSLLEGLERLNVSRKQYFDSGTHAGWPAHIRRAAAVCIAAGSRIP